ncbi:hypothetical protein PAXRUDRAFT_166436 [Paxillus rubicundulus Ve08.2h10]|uniref:Unplaced genomic scaffold scaffold_2109, whole genome shotgun sequence n=1 Tax=Paxillus rubicundulus Ve08.2h10 TaxID=930991 RepID=A0A0D0DAL3_9AGAM|nr:hypothetical protein PAXRUDRAFT_166436 [Paxillus rubicundulus Ve08.2h10]
MTQWRDAQMKKDRDKIFKETGVQWSKLLCLPYWDPTRFLAINSMHNIFLSLVQFHFRDLIVVDKPENQEFRRTNPPSAKPVDNKELEKARELLKSGAFKTLLNQIHLTVLLKLLEESR